VVYNTKINKNTSHNELINTCYLHIHDNSKYLDESLSEEELKARVTTLAQTAIKIFYRDYNVVQKPKYSINQIKKKYTIIDSDVTYNIKHDNHQNSLEYEAIKSLNPNNNPEKKYIFFDSIKFYHDEIKMAFLHLTNAETFVIENRLYNYLDEIKTLKELSKEMNISIVRVSQIESNGMEKLRYYLRNIKKGFKS